VTAKGIRDARPWTYAALFGTLWGALEVSLGSILYLSRIPFSGTLMSALGLLCLITLRRLQPRPGVCLLAGVVALFLKVFTLGGFYPGPLIGIAAEATLTEIAFTLSGSRWIGAVMGGALTLGWTPVQMLVSTWVIAGPEAISGFARAAEIVLNRLNVPAVAPIATLIGFVAFIASVGAGVGWWSWRVAGRVRRRLGGRP
jgi:hypothetical protein